MPARELGYESQEIWKTMKMKSVASDFSRAIRESAAVEEEDDVADKSDAAGGSGGSPSYQLKERPTKAF